MFLYIREFPPFCASRRNDIFRRRLRIYSTQCPYVWEQNNDYDICTKFNNN